MYTYFRYLWKNNRSSSTEFGAFKHPKRTTQYNLKML